MPRLIVIKGPDEGKQFNLLASPTGVGRERTNPVCIHDTEVSRRHAEIFPAANGTYRIRDLHSANGTLVNTQPIQDAQLNPGDHIQLGKTILVFTPDRTETPQSTDLADRIRVVTRPDTAFSSAIVKTIEENEGSRILARPERAGTQWLKDRLANLSIMYETIQAVSHILDLDQLLDRILELIFESIVADHGCIMLRNLDTDEFEPKSVRFRQPGQSKQTIAISHTIVEHVLTNKQGVLVADADDRFGSDSIKRFNLHEVICVPMKGRHEIHGVLFLGTYSTTKDFVAQGKEGGTAKLNEDHLALAIAIAHQAALAVEETRYHQALVHSERLAAVGQTIAALSHHIKNIMQGIVFGSDMVRAGLADKDDNMLQKGWKLVEKNQGKIHELVLDMLSYSKDREPAIEMVSLNTIVEDVIELVRGRIDEQKIRLEIRLSPTMPSVPADPDGIHKALLNLVGNAIDALDGRPDPYLAVQTLLETGGAWARIVVLDHGMGIPPEKLKDIFRPFVSSKGARGTGLGLAVSQKILREHGGEIQVQSQVEKGSKFIMRLPMRSPHQADVFQTGAHQPLRSPEDES